MSDPKRGAREVCEGARARLLDVSHRIHAHPETAFEEERASGWLADELDAAGFRVERGAFDIPTAFTARKGSGPLHVAFCAEYDSLPGIGHACGHNMIAAMSLGAGLAAARVADDVGLTVSVIGTPAEEVGNRAGKILLLDRGAFGDVHAAMMVHPAPFDVIAPPMIAVCEFEVHYTGKEAHASAFPEKGINAADALTIAQTAIGLLRQHIRPSDRVHGFITKGGEAANVIPAHTAARYMVRARTVEELGDIKERVLRCFEAGSIASGAKLEIVGGDRPDTEVRHDPRLAALYAANAIAAGRTFPDLGSALDRGTGSTDMGNVSLAVPSIHPFIGIDSLPAVNHQPEFAAHCVTPSADRAVFEGALALAWTAIDTALDRELSAALRARA